MATFNGTIKIDVRDAKGGSWTLSPHKYTKDEGELWMIVMGGPFAMLAWPQIPVPVFSDWF